MGLFCQPEFFLPCISHFNLNFMYRLCLPLYVFLSSCKGIMRHQVEPSWDTTWVFPVRQMSRICLKIH